MLPRPALRVDQMLALRLAGGRPPEARGPAVRHSQCCYSIQSASVKGRRYTVVGAGDSWQCTRLSYCYRGAECRHIAAARAVFGPSEPAPAPDPIAVRSVRPGTCPKCGSGDSKKDGVRRSRLYANQKYKCRGCGAHFSANAGMGRTKLPPEAVCDVMQMAASCVSSRRTRDYLAAKGVDVCAKTVCNTVRRFSESLLEYCDGLRPAVSEVWRTDEMHVRVCGGAPYLHSVIDDATRFMLSEQLTARKGEDDVSPMLASSAVLAGKVPHLLISDGAGSFRAAWASCYEPGNDLQKHAAHAAMIHLDGNMNNNKMERFNRELRRYVQAAQVRAGRAVRHGKGGGRHGRPRPPVLQLFPQALGPGRQDARRGGRHRGGGPQQVGDAPAKRARRQGVRIAPPARPAGRGRCAPAPDSAARRPRRCKKSAPAPEPQRGQLSP